MRNNTNFRVFSRRYENDFWEKKEIQKIKMNYNLSWFVKIKMPNCKATQTIIHFSALRIFFELNRSSKIFLRTATAVSKKVMNVHNV